MKVLIYCLLTKLSKVLVSFFWRERERKKERERDREGQGQRQGQRETETETERDRDSATIHNRCDRNFVC